MARGEITRKDPSRGRIGIVVDTGGDAGASSLRRAGQSHGQAGAALKQSTNLMVDVFTQIEAQNSANANTTYIAKAEAKERLFLAQNEDEFANNPKMAGESLKGRLEGLTASGKSILNATGAAQHEARMVSMHSAALVKAHGTRIELNKREAISAVVERSRIDHDYWTNKISESNTVELGWANASTALLDHDEKRRNFEVEAIQGNLTSVTSRSGTLVIDGIRKTFQVMEVNILTEAVMRHAIGIYEESQLTTAAAHSFLNDFGARGLEETVPLMASSFIEKQDLVTGKPVPRFSPADRRKAVAQARKHLQHMWAADAQKRKLQEWENKQEVAELLVAAKDSDIPSGGKEKWKIKMLGSVSKYLENPLATPTEGASLLAAVGARLELEEEQKDITTVRDQTRRWVEEASKGKFDAKRSAKDIYEMGIGMKLGVKARGRLMEAYTRIQNSHDRREAGIALRDFKIEMSKSGNQVNAEAVEKLKNNYFLNAEEAIELHSAVAQHNNEVIEDWMLRKTARLEEAIMTNPAYWTMARIDAQLGILNVMPSQGDEPPNALAIALSKSTALKARLYKIHWNGIKEREAINTGVNRISGMVASGQGIVDPSNRYLPHFYKREWDKLNVDWSSHLNVAHNANIIASKMESVGVLSDEAKDFLSSTSRLLGNTHDEGPLAAGLELYKRLAGAQLDKPLTNQLSEKEIAFWSQLADETLGGAGTIGDAVNRMRARQDKAEQDKVLSSPTTQGLMKFLGITIEGDTDNKDPFDQSISQINKNSLHFETTTVMEKLKKHMINKGTRSWLEGVFVKTVGDIVDFPPRMKTDMLKTMQSIFINYAGTSNYDSFFDRVAEITLSNWNTSQYANANDIPRSGLWGADPSWMFRSPKSHYLDPLGKTDYIGHQLRDRFEVMIPQGVIDAGDLKAVDFLNPGQRGDGSWWLVTSKATLEDDRSMPVYEIHFREDGQNKIVRQTITRLGLPVEQNYLFTPNPDNSGTVLRMKERAEALREVLRNKGPFVNFIYRHGAADLASWSDELVFKVGRALSESAFGDAARFIYDAGVSDDAIWNEPSRIHELLTGQTEDMSVDEAQAVEREILEAMQGKTPPGYRERRSLGASPHPVFSPGTGP